MTNVEKADLVEHAESVSNAENVANVQSLEIHTEHPGENRKVRVLTLGAVLSGIGVVLLALLTLAYVVVTSNRNVEQSREDVALTRSENAELRAELTCRAQSQIDLEAVTSELALATAQLKVDESRLVVALIDDAADPAELRQIADDIDRSQKRVAADVVSVTAAQDVRKQAIAKCQIPEPEENP